MRKSQWSKTLPALLLFFGAQAGAQEFAKSLDFQLGQIGLITSAPAKVAKIDDVLQKVLQNKLELATLEKMQLLVRMREEQCQKAIPECSDFSQWLPPFCDEVSAKIPEVVIKGLWKAIGDQAQTPEGYAKVFKQFKSSCSNAASAVAFLHAMDFRRSIAMKKPAEVGAVQDWIRATWKAFPVPMKPAIDAVVTVNNEAMATRPLELDYVLFTVRLGESWIRAAKFGREKTMVLDFAQSTVLPGLWNFSLLSDILAVVGTTPLKEEIDAKSSFTISVIDVLCDTWQRTGNTKKCDLLLSQMAQNKTRSPYEKRRLDIARMQQAYFQGRVADAERGAKSLSAEIKDPNDMSNTFVHFLLAVYQQDLGKYAEATGHLDARAALMKKNPNSPASMTLIGDNLRVTILTKEKKFAEARALSDQILVDIGRSQKGLTEFVAWAYYARLKLAILSGDKAETAASTAKLNSLVTELPGVGFLKDLAAYISAPATPQGEAALERARQLLGSEHPWIKETLIFKSGK